MIPTSHAAARGRPYGLIRKAIISQARPGKNPATKNSTNAAKKMIPERIPSIEANYKEDIVACVEKYGPYIVLMPNIAMPHSQEGAEGVHKTSIGFMKLDKPVSFDPEDPEKDAQLFFTLASCNPEQHMNNMVRLSELLMNEEVVAALLKAETPEDLLEIQKQYLD